MLIRDGNVTRSSRRCNDTMHAWLKGECNYLGPIQIHGKNLIKGGSAWKSRDNNATMTEIKCNKEGYKWIHARQHVYSSNDTIKVAMCSHGLVVYASFSDHFVISILSKLLNFDNRLNVICKDYLLHFLDYLHTLYLNYYK